MTVDGRTGGHGGVDRGVIDDKMSCHLGCVGANCADGLVGRLKGLGGYKRVEGKRGCDEREKVRYERV